MKAIQKGGACLLAALAILAGANPVAAQGTTFMYQGNLSSNGVPANGFYDFEFSLYPDADGTGGKVGATITQTNLGVTNGLFTTALDFGAVFTGNDTWLAISVRSNGVGGYTALTPLQGLTPTPYAMFASTAGNLSGSLPAAQLSGTIPFTQLPATVVTNDEAGVTLSNVTVSGTLTLPLPALVDAGGNSLFIAPGNNNFYAGPSAGVANGLGGANTGLGGGSLQSNSNGTNNTGLGYATLGNNVNGSYNTASGERALASNTSGNDNTADGRHAMVNNLVGDDNTASGYLALSADTNGSQNTALGASALSGLTSGSNNVALGYLAGSKYGLGESSNIVIGNIGTRGENNTIRIGDSQTQTYIAGVINGNGGGLTNLNASQLASGAIPLGQLPAAVLTNNESGAVTLNNVTVGGILSLPFPANVNTGSSHLLHADNKGNFFAGLSAGNLTTSGSDNTALGSGSLFLDSTGTENTAGGDGALFDNTVGSYNTAFGQTALQGNVSGSNNTAVGLGSMAGNSSGGENVAIGYGALFADQSGSANVAIGYSALGNSTIEGAEVAIGYEALMNDATGGGFIGSGGNTAVGYQVLKANTSGSDNTAMGWLAMNNNSSGQNNTAIGLGALANNSSAAQNTAVGAFGLEENTTGSNNTAVGYGAMINNTTGNNNTAYGFSSMGGSATSSSGGNTATGGYTLYDITDGYNNTAAGYEALYADSTGVDNVGIGVATFQANSAGSANTGVGTYAFQLMTAGTGNVGIGYYAGHSLIAGTNNIYIGNSGAESDNEVIRIGDTQSETYIAGTVNCDALFTGPHTCCNITITGGCDLAEPFPISAAEQQVGEGAVVVIDETNPGHVKLADRPYDTRVAGVVSGANGVNPGIQMQQQGLLEGGRNVALTGRVYVQADASNGAIEPGDLLTTSGAPGRAMKVTDHGRAEGAILGKAMTGLSEGKGMVLVLVTLQ